MRVGTTLQIKALFALEQAVQECRYGRVRRTYALRFALAYLWSLDGGSRDPYRDLWCTLDGWNGTIRYRDADRALTDIHRRLRMPRDERQSKVAWRLAEDEYQQRRAVEERR